MDDRPTQEAPPELGQEKIPLQFQVPVGLSSRYAHHLVIQSTDQEVILSFFELKPPIVLGSEEVQRAALKDGITAECVARVIVAKARYPDFVRALSDFPSEGKSAGVNIQ